ncbi:MAG: CRISPR system precrRNA processing endoribonuclease RAMP protein Cas6 [bacterium]
MRSEGEASLPPFKGSTIRGAFGRAFRRVSCALRRSTCDGCLLLGRCAYSYVFETPLPPGSSHILRSESVPRPFVVEPPLDSKMDYDPDEKLSFSLILVGRAIAYLPYFVLAFVEMGKAGMGRERARFSVLEVRASDPSRRLEEVIYEGEEGLLRESDIRLGLDSVLPGDRVEVSFLTPTRLRYGGGYEGRPEFHVLVRNLLRRLSALAYFHCGGELEVDRVGLIERAECVKLVGGDLRWVRRERYSGRQGRRVSMGGIVGGVIYEGDIEPFRELLLLGERVHVGKGCTYGLGRYEIKSELSNQKMSS